MTNRRVIWGFQRQMRFLSNFWPLNERGLTAEHVYQASKTSVPAESAWVFEALTPGEAKRRGAAVTLADNWNDVRVEVMTQVVREKFRDPELGAQLLATGEALLVEANTWGDTFWGVDQATGRGENWLGQVLMLVRAELSQEA